MDYLEWNHAIGAHFFNPDRNGVRVFLYVTKNVVKKIGAPYDANLDNFVNAVKTGPPWNTRKGRGICQQALQAFENWRTRDLEYPPYLAYLALFVLADTIDTGFACHAYYPGLKKLLGEEVTAGTYPSFHHMHCLWDDLAVWSNQDKHGNWGIFSADIVGEWMHVGIPRAQTLLTDEERYKLPLLFSDNGFDPQSPPSDKEIAYLLANDNKHRLRPHTKEILNSPTKNNSLTHTALVEIILDELEHWDGTVSTKSHTGEEVRSSLGNLRLVMMLDQTARTARFSLRCRSNWGYPDEGLKLTGDGVQDPLYCYEDWQGWSTPLSFTETQQSIFDPSHLDWMEGLSLTDRDHTWVTTFSKRPFRIMVNAALLGFDGFVEQSQIPVGKPFYLLAHNQHAEMIRTWGNEYCEGFTEIDLISKLPSRWRLYSIDSATTDVLLRDTIPELAFSTILRIQLRGGIKVKRNQYMNFALPQIEVNGVLEGINVFCNDHQLILDNETGLYTIPDNLNTHKLIVEVKRDDVCIRKKSLYALNTIAWRNVVPIEYFDKFGRPTGEGVTETFTGPIVKGVTPPAFNSEDFLPPSEGHCVYFIGRNPGEIVEYPQKPLPDEWQPVWVVQKQGRRNGTVIYCGANPANEEPLMTSCNDRKHRCLWRKVLWIRRKRIIAPSHPKLRALWQKYNEVAQRVR